MNAYAQAIYSATLSRRLGQIRRMAGLAIESAGPDAGIGEICRLLPESGESTLAEVVGVRPGHVVLMPYGSIQGLAAGCSVEAIGAQADIAVGSELLGRIIDGFGNVLDEKPPVYAKERRPLRASPINPLHRRPIETVMETGVKVIDGLLPIGHGQRVGIFAGSGVGKSTLLGMIARSSQADVNVIALIGERGREVRDFVERQLGPEGLARSVVVVATSDQPALARVRAAYAALAVAEYFRDMGRQVFLTMDSVTRFAMARREIGLAAGEPPTARGYTPSVFAEIPELCERCGSLKNGGSITAFFNVLVEGDDFNDPVADSLRATLDGHIVLSRDIAHQGHFPAVDALKSASRLVSDLTTKAERQLMARAVACLALIERNRSMVELGAYRRGSNGALDAALDLADDLSAWLRQDSDACVARTDTLRELERLFPESGGAQA